MSKELGAERRAIESRAQRARPRGVVVDHRPVCGPSDAQGQGQDGNSKVEEFDPNTIAGLGVPGNGGLT